MGVTANRESEPTMASTIIITLSSDEQRVRLREWHDKTHVMHIAHSKAATWLQLESKALGVLVAIFGAVTGTTLYASWQGSPSTTVQWVTGTIAIVSVILAALQTALSPGKHSAEHHQAATRYGKLRREMEEWRIEHPNAAAPEQATLDAWLKSWLEIESSAPTVTGRQLKQAETRVGLQQARTPDPW